jgi:hypothetical protein
MDLGTSDVRLHALNERRARLVIYIDSRLRLRYTTGRDTSTATINSRFFELHCENINGPKGSLHFRRLQHSKRVRPSKTQSSNFVNDFSLSWSHSCVSNRVELFLRE